MTQDRCAWYAYIPQRRLPVLEIPVCVRMYACRCMWIYGSIRLTQRIPTES